jgi:hypothetical protein
MAKPPLNPGLERIAGALPQLPHCQLLEDMRNNPAGDWTIRNVETLCTQTGLSCKPPRRGSHYKVCSKHFNGMLTIPAQRRLKAPYIKLLVYMVDTHRAAEAQGD